MIFPIGDTNVQGGYKPLFSYSFIAINILIFLLQISVPGNLVCDFATIPDSVASGDKLYTLITSMFMHGGWMHLIGNMMFLWIFADNIEAVVGNKNFLIFYLVGGVLSALIHVGIDLVTAGDMIAGCCNPCGGVACDTAGALCPGSVPSLGASGAIAAVMGAYIVMFPKSQIKMFFFFSTIRISAYVFLGFWFLEQFISGVGSLGPVASGGVAWWAHIGGFVVGLLFGWQNRHHMAYVDHRQSA